ncbi:unnamed protein product [Victoria cruziana]
MIPALLLCFIFLSLHQATALDQLTPDVHYQPGGGHALCRTIECPKYTMVHVDPVRNLEVREYQNPIWVFANHPPASSYRKALCAHAPILSSYLKGNNDLNTTISETAPALVIVIPGLYHADNADAPFGDAYHFARYLPQNFQLTATPPSNTTVRFWRFPPENHYVVVKKFREGAVNDTIIDNALTSLRKSLKGSPWERRVIPYGGFAVADYNYPDTNGTTKNEILLLAEKEWMNDRGGL